MMMVDAYTHVCSKGYLELLLQSGDGRVRKWAENIAGLASRWPQFVDLGKRLDHMDRYGVSWQVAGVHSRLDPNRFLLRPEEEIALCRALNDGMAEIVEKTRGRILCLATPPLNSLENGGVDEMRRAVRELGLKGFMVLTNIGGKPIDRFELFWKTAKELDAVVYIHPTDPYQTSCRIYEDEYDLTRTVGWPFETTLILLRLVLSGMMENLEGMKIVAHHAGGMIPFFIGRISTFYSPSMVRTKPEQISQVRVKDPERIAEKIINSFYFDTAVGGNKHAVKCAYEVLGSSRMLFATDYPYGPDGMGTDGLSTFPSILREIGIPEDELESIMYRNAEMLFKNR
jgi:predicted TIM-barrel fold metal-dependent hydrolase